MPKKHRTTKYHKQRRKERANARAKKQQQLVSEVEQMVTQPTAPRPSMDEAFK